MRAILFALSWSFVASAAFAKDDAPSKETQKLDKLLVGLWSSELTATLAKGDVLNLRGEMKCDRVANGFGVLCATDAQPSEHNVREMWLLSYEKATKSVHHFIIEGESSHDHIGKWADEDTLEIKRAPAKSSCNLVELTLKRTSEDRLVISAIENDEQGKEDRFVAQMKAKQKKEYPESTGKEEPSQALKKLDAMLLGKGSLEENVTLGDGTKKREHARVACDNVGAGFGIQCVLDWEPKTGLAQEYWLLGYDKKSLSVHLFVIAGESAHDHIGTFNEKGELVIGRAPCASGPCPEENMVLRRIDERNTVLEGSARDEKGSPVHFRFDLKR